MKKFVHEHFNTINEMLNTLNQRPNNEAMSGQTSSQKTGDKQWNGTENYDEAIDLIHEGYADILADIKNNLRKNAKTYSKYLELPAKMPKNEIVGYIPNVPNSLLNLPNSMINIDLIPQKRKTLDIYYSNCGNCGESTEFFIKSGTALLTAINIIEAKGIRVRLNLLFMSCEASEQVCCPSLLLKSYGQKFDIQKLCFPLAHPSMFRRFGFKFLETSPDIEDRNFRCGYGHPYDSLDNIHEGLNLDDTQFVISSSWIRNHDYNVEEILNKFNIKKEN